MYNRYIPQPDGTFRRNKVQDHPHHSPLPPPGDIPQNCTPDHPNPPKAPPSRQGQSITAFLRQILPKNLDTGDLLIILMLLLIAGDCAEDQNMAMLTLAMYLFM